MTPTRKRSMSSSEAEDVRNPYPQRATEVGVLASAEGAGVQAVSPNSPCIFGTGTGLFNR